ncbi:glycosyltransferase family 39 protein [Cellulomonas sp. S1-8]|uniref:glycosyltransferase family 39 protein n=1 Tax=Cellulomonas sp. S1-8 TaxID=2904790 RepID=UPI0022435584|nr:glycosyltransferase family 39 protein [Cellulomonas sp. S1-8]UZN02443.1 glycosyltransferase family 39 protein [Cellulomonas sp. S1-8]
MGSRPPVAEGTPVGVASARTSSLTPTAREVRPDPSVVRDALVLGCAVALLCVAGAWIPSLWLDEVATVSAVGRSWPEMVALLGHVDAVHGTYYTGMHLWADVFGTSPLSLRTPSAVATGVAAAGVVVLGNELGSRTTGILAGCAFAVLPATTWMGVEARGHAFVTATTTWAVVVLVRALRGRAPWWGYAVLLGLSGLLFVQSLVLLAAHGVTLLWARTDRRLLRSWLVAAAGALAIASPAVLAGARQRYQIGWIDRPGVDSAHGVLTRQWFDGSWWFLGAVAVLVVVALVSRRAPGPWPPRAALVHVALPWAVVPTLVVLGVSLVATPLWDPRYLRYCAPAVALLIGVGVEALRRRWAQVVALVVLSAIAAPVYAAQRAEFAKDDADLSAVARHVAERSDAGDVVVFVPEDDARSPRRALEGYPQDFTGVVDVGTGPDRTATDSLWERGRPVDALADELASARRVWVLSTGDARSRDALRWLEENGFEGDAVWSGPTTQLHLFTASGD